MYEFMVMVVDIDGVEEQLYVHDGIEDALRKVRKLVREAMDSENTDSVFGIQLR